MTHLPTFTGTPAERALAEQVHAIMRMQGRFFAHDAPIRQRLSHLVQYFAPQRGGDENQTTRDLIAALTANTSVFAQSTDGDDVVVTTARDGGYNQPEVDIKHSLGTRLYEPVNPLPIDDLSVIMTTSRPIIPKIDPVYVSDYWLNGGTSTEIPDDDITTEEQPGTLIGATPSTASKAPYAHRDTRIALPQGITIDISQSLDHIMAMHGDAIVHAMRNAIEKDTMKRFVMFGNLVAAELDVRSFGKNEIRSITEYIEDEREEPVLDKDILDHVLRINPRSTDYERQRFALNVRLQKERDLEFVGVAGANLWATRKLLDKIGANKRIKSADMAILVNHLEEGFDDSLTVTSAETLAQRGAIEHKLTFFEWEYGILPFTDAVAAILPAKVIGRQNNAILTFEVPQRGFSANINVRFPLVGTRGGWLQGFDELFHELLVPGAILTIAQTNKPNVLTISFKETAERVEDVLYVDDSKKKSKFAFGEMTIAVAVDDDYLPTRNRIGNIRKVKFFEFAERKNILTLIENIFVGFGKEVGSKQAPAYRLDFEQLFTVISVYRCVTRSYLMNTLTEAEQCTLVSGATGTWECRVELTENERATSTSGYYNDEDDD
ncbi:MAG: hypothetical protein ACK46D_17480 [Roseiflexaceae bacterium]|jgi:hypothetical protein